MLFSRAALSRDRKVHLQYKSYRLAEAQVGAFLAPSVASLDVERRSRRGDKFIYSLT